MSLDHIVVNKIAKLARINMQEEELPNITKDLSNILNLCEQLQEVNTENVEAITGVNFAHLPLVADIAKHDNTVEDVLKNAPKQEYNCFVVPKVIE